MDSSMRKARLCSELPQFSVAAALRFPVVKNIPLCPHIAEGAFRQAVNFSLFPIVIVFRLRSDPVCISLRNMIQQR